MVLSSGKCQAIEVKLGRGRRDYERAVFTPGGKVFVIERKKHSDDWTAVSA